MDSIEFGTEKEDFAFYRIPRNSGKQKTMIADMSRRHCSYNVLGKPYNSGQLPSNLSNFADLGDTHDSVSGLPKSFLLSH